MIFSSTSVTRAVTKHRPSCPMVRQRVGQEVKVTYRPQGQWWWTSVYIPSLRNTSPIRATWWQL